MVLVFVPVGVALVMFSIQAYKLNCSLSLFIKIYDEAEMRKKDELFCKAKLFV
jgi:hypothetical protein